MVRKVQQGRGWQRCGTLTRFFRLAQRGRDSALAARGRAN
jgi:hypothetical protein